MNRIRGKSSILWALCLVAWFGFASALAAQGNPAPAPSQGQGQQQAQQPSKPAAAPSQSGQPAAPAAEAPADPAEKKAFDDFNGMKQTKENLDRSIQSGEEFLQKYPASRYRAPVYSRLTQAYFNKYQMDNNPQAMDKMYAAGAKALELKPDDYITLVTLGWVIPHAYNASELDAQQKLDKAEQYSRHALELLPTIAKPEGLDDAEFTKLRNQALSQGHSGLGLVYFRKGRFADSIPELQQATKLAPEPDAVDFFVMGFDYQQLKQYADAAAAFDECGKIPGGFQQRCKQSADQAKQLASNKPLAPKK